MAAQTEHALVVHLFTIADDDRATAWLGECWARCAAEFEMTEQIDRLHGIDFPDIAGHTSGVLAARQNPDPGAEFAQSIVHLHHDVLVLSVAVSRKDGTELEALEHRWQTALGESAPGRILGEVRIRTTRQAEYETVRGTSGRVRVYGHTTIDEIVVDQPRRRVFEATTSRAREAELDSWLWTRGDDAIAPFAVYLLHAAKVRHQQRLRDKNDRRIRALPDEVDDLIRRRFDSAGDDSALHVIRRELARLLSEPDSLGHLGAQLREMALTVRIAAENLRRHAARFPFPATLFAADIAHADRLATRLSDDVVYLDAARERAATTLSELSAGLEETARRRDTRTNLLQTAMTGALIMMLTAVQALGYKLRLPAPVQPAVIGVLGAAALVFATSALWRFQTGSALVRATLSGIAGILGAAVGWLVSTIVHHLRSGGSAPVPATIAVCAALFLATAVTASVWQQIKHRQRHG